MPGNPTTQKGKGVVALQNEGMSTPHLWGFFKTPDQLDHPGLVFPCFARPCPKRPRHGFVDSRKVNSREEAIAVLSETLAADPEGELMLMSNIPAPKWNVVWTPTLLTIGEGNDGATAGRDVVSIPLVRHQSLQPLLLSQAGIGQDEDPYIEIVRADSGITYYTQIRAGVKMGMISKNYIPSTVTVKKILHTREDGKDFSLLEWEKLIQSHASDEGVVVYHPGGSFSDHYTVHARTFGIPVILETNPDLSIGQVLEKESEEIIPDPQAVLRGLVAAEKLPLGKGTSRSDGVALLLTCLYNASVMGGEYAKWIGVGVGLMIRFGMAALAGEARHFRPDGRQMVDRDIIYHKNFPFSYSRHHARVNRLTNILRYGFAGGGVGGEKWAKCGASLYPLFNCIRELSREPKVKTVQKMIRALNVSVDQAHNNGWWLNKFSGKELYIDIQAGNIAATIQGAGRALEVDRLYQSLKKSQIDQQVSKWAGWDEIHFTAIRPNRAVIVSLNGLPGMSIKWKSRILGEYQKEISIPSDIITAKLNDLIGSVYLVPGKHGIKVELRKGNETTTIFEEPKLL